MLTRRAGLTYEALRGEFRWELPARYNLGVDVCDRQPARRRRSSSRTGARSSGPSPSASSATRRTGSRTRSAPGASGPAIAWASSSRSGPRPRSPTSPSTSSARSPCRSPSSSAPTRSRCVSATRSRRRDRRSRVARRVAERGLEAIAIDVDRDLPHLLAAASPRFDAAATGPDTPGARRLHLRHDRPAEGRAPRSPRPLRPPAGVRALARLLPAARTTGSGRRPTGPGSAASSTSSCPASHHGRPVVAFRRREFDPELAFDLIAPARRPERLHPADRAAADARSGGDARSRSARSRAAARRSARRRSRGASSARGARERVLRPDGGEPADRQLSLGLADPAGLDGPCLPRPRGPAGRRRDLRSRRRRPGRLPRLLARTRRRRPRRCATAGCRPATSPTRTRRATIRFVGRVDDLISSGGYRIGPGEIEDCLIRHPSVSIAAVIGVAGPGARRDREGVRRDRAGAPAVSGAGRRAPGLVRERLAAYEYPREIEFVDELPLTTTGKIRRGELRRLEAERAAATTAKEA